MERAITQLVYYLERDVSQAMSKRKAEERMATLHTVRDLLKPKKTEREEAVCLSDLGDIKSKADWLVGQVEKYVMRDYRNDVIANIMTDSQMISERTPEGDEVLTVAVHAIANLIRGRIKVRQPWKERK
jgi:hypothetical protein